MHPPEVTRQTARARSMRLVSPLARMVWMVLVVTREVCTTPHRTRKRTSETRTVSSSMDGGAVRDSVRAL